MTEGKAAANIPINIQVSIQDMPGPQGTVKMVGLHVDMPFASFVVGMPSEMARHVGQSLPAGLLEAAAKCDQLNSGLVVASAQTLDVLKNGRKK